MYIFMKKLSLLLLVLFPMMVSAVSDRIEMGVSPIRIEFVATP